MTDGTETGRPGAIAAPGLVEHFFRHEYGRLVAVLDAQGRACGISTLVEDAVQGALLTALTAWTAQGASGGSRRLAVPRGVQQPDRRPAAEDRSAADSGAGRRRGRSGRRRPSGGVVFRGRGRGRHAAHALRLLRRRHSRESQLVLALKTLCGFSTAEIALRLFTSEANVYKRLARARERLREIAPDIETPPLDTLRSRLPSVQAVLYLLFNEGYLSSHAEDAIRRELCDEAVRLATLLAEHSVGAVPETFALLALMHLHAARLGARRDATGGLLLLEEQDRSLWDRERMRIGAEWLERSATGERVLAIPRGGRHRRGALLRAVVRAHALEGDRRSLRDAGAHRPIAAAHDEPGGGRRRMARARRRARLAGSPRAAGVAGWLVPLGRRTRRSASTRREPGERATTSRSRARLGAYGGRAGPPPAPAGDRGLSQARHHHRTDHRGPTLGCSAVGAAEPQATLRIGLLHK